MTGVDKLQMGDEITERGCRAYKHTARFQLVTGNDSKTKKCTKIPLEKLTKEEHDALEGNVGTLGIQPPI